jgi:peptide/nickel transport system substrate-binding protein
MAGYALNFPVIPAHHSDFFQPVSSGAFVFYEYTPMRSLSLRRNPHNSRNRAQIELVEVLLLPDLETDFHAFDRGLIDVLHLPLSDWARHQGVRSPNYDIFPAMYFEFIGFNYTRSIFRDFITRQGIAHSFNAAEAVQSLYLAHAVRSVTPIHPYSWAANAEILGPTYDPDRAAALLGILRIPEPLEILANEENSQRVAIAKKLAASLNRAGLPANAVIVPADEYFSRLASHNFDLFVGGMKLPFAPDVEFFFQNSPLFMFDAQLEAAFANVQLASTEIAYVQALQNLQQVFADRLPVIGLAFKHSALLTTPRVHGGINPTPCRVFSNANEWLIY